MPQRGHTRSRAGCLTCRQRHIRCDEQRPSCLACRSGNRSCNYPPAVIPLRDRRILQKSGLPPGQQAPWALIDTQSLMRRRVPRSTAIDPFDALPLKMPYKSRELYHYFYQTGAAFAVAPPNPKDDCIALATLDEHALRSTILIAGVHYAWNTGDLQAYEAAYLFHKVESMRVINKWLQTFDSKMFAVCVRQILTICLSEACLANLPAAETHLDGVMALFDSHDTINSPADTFYDLDRELANHYLLLTSCFVLCLKSRLEDFLLFSANTSSPTTNSENTTTTTSPEQAIILYQKWHGMEYLGLDTRLKAMRLFPYFFSPPPSNIPRSKKILVDAVPIIECIRSITETLDAIRANPHSEHMHRVWNDGGPTRLLLGLVTAHVDAFLSADDGRAGAGAKPGSGGNGFRTAFSGIAAAMELYMHSVLGIMNAGAPMECRLLYRVLLILQRDVEGSRCDMFAENGSMHQSLWFWKVFTGIMALARSKHVYGLDTRLKTTPASRAGCFCPCQQRLERLYRWFRDCARSWSVVSGCMMWEEVEPILMRIAWPCVLTCEISVFAADTWVEVFL
ncbi:hypothetical protein BJX64DRAFT_48157 [Aspergillus heterothallicus]